MGVEPVELWCGAMFPMGTGMGQGRGVVGLTGRADVLSSSGHSAVFVSPPHSMEGTAHSVRVENEAERKCAEATHGSWHTGTLKACCSWGLRMHPLWLWLPPRPGQAGGAYS